MPAFDKPGKLRTADVQNFDEVVNRNGKDTFIKFFLPQCIQCKIFAPVFTSLVDQMRDEDVAFVQMDVSVDDAPSPYNTVHFPTLYWAPKNDKSHPVKYEGNLALDELVKFLSKCATVELRGFDRNGKRK